jgi:CRP/FNR family transcriptional regulator, anaerobic regulatory protein
VASQDQRPDPTFDARERRVSSELPADRQASGAVERERGDGAATESLRGSHVKFRPELHEQVSAGTRELHRIFKLATMVAVADGEVLIEAGRTARAAYLLHAGWACRARRIRDRQSIIDVYLPGDLIGVDTALHHHAPGSVVMAGRGTVHAIDAGNLLAGVMAKPSTCLAAAWVAAEAQRRMEHLAGVILRLEGPERVALALFDFHARLRRHGLLAGLSYNLPLTQRQLGDYVGMTPIHVNRVLRMLREQRIVIVDNHVVIITDYARLARLVDAGIRDLPPLA